MVKSTSDSRAAGSNDRKLSQELPRLVEHWQLDIELEQPELLAADGFVTSANQHGENERLGGQRLAGGGQQRLGQRGHHPAGVLKVLGLRRSDVLDQALRVRGPRATG